MAVSDGPSPYDRPRKAWWVIMKADDLWQRLMQRLTAILVALYVLVILTVLLLGFWSSRKMKHERCLESLRSQTVNPAIIMSLCRD